MTDFVEVKHKDQDHTVRVPVQSLPTWEARGFARLSGSQPAESAATESTDPVPEGSVDEIVEWVGDDRERAQRALDVEQASERPRKTAVAAFEAVLAASPETSDGDTSDNGTAAGSAETTPSETYDAARGGGSS